ncbi:unnamed protein product [Toxocara canis]|uniref:Thioredoxin domain-containing protein n=1 Tax=Toxocara canis TaxID=6265 RepID=A0A183V8F2_TOXCA|nr:unnamed protein product [Toxocara canis]
MIVTPIATLLLLVALLHSSTATIDIKQIYESPLSHGFGEDIDWVRWEDAVETALEKDKPIFLLIHKSWCHACKALKKTFQQSNARKAFKILSEYFVMVNTEDDDEPYEEEYRPDGKYIPRLLFLDKNGDLLPEFVNKKAEYKNYAYYYSSPADILNSMKDVIRFYNIEVCYLVRISVIILNNELRFTHITNIIFSCEFICVRRTFKIYFFIFLNEKQNRKNRQRVLKKLRYSAFWKFYSVK